MKTMSRLSFTCLGILTMAVMMMTSPYSKAQVAPSNYPIKTITFGEYQEYKKSITSKQEDQAEDSSAKDLTTIKEDWTQQEASDFVSWKNKNDSEFSYDFLTREELQNASDTGEFPYALSNEWIIDEDNNQLVLFSYSDDEDLYTGALSVLQKTKTASSSRNDNTGSVVSNDGQDSTTVIPGTTPSVNSSYWPTNRELECVGAGLVIGGAFVALGGPAACIAGGVAAYEGCAALGSAGYAVGLFFQRMFF